MDVLRRHELDGQSFGPFICLQAVILAILIIFPQISLFMVR